MLMDTDVLYVLYVLYLLYVLYVLGLNQGLISQQVQEACIEN
jgi:hypothetical protein